MYHHIIPVFHVPKEIELKFQLLIGWNPFSNSMCTEEEEKAPLRLSRFFGIDEIKKTTYYSKNIKDLAVLYSEQWPEILSENAGDFERICKMWKLIIDLVEVPFIGYYYKPDGYISNNDFKHETFFKKLDTFGFKSLQKHYIHWVLEIYGEIAELIDHKVGLTSTIKQGVCLDEFPFGFIARYMAKDPLSFNSALNYRQWEELIGKVYEDMGWQVKRTKCTRDGGKDAVLERIDNNESVIAYLEVKNWNSQISVNHVREFYGVLKHDQIEKGFFVSTSGFSKDCGKWIESKPNDCSVILQLVSGDDIYEILSRKAEEDLGSYIFNSR